MEWPEPIRPRISPWVHVAYALSLLVFGFILGQLVRL